jgi:hypothetical protein
MRITSSKCFRESKTNLKAKDDTDNTETEAVEKKRHHTRSPAQFDKHPVKCTHIPEPRELGPSLHPGCGDSGDCGSRNGSDSLRCRAAVVRGHLIALGDGRLQPRFKLHPSSLLRNTTTNPLTTY